MLPMVSAAEGFVYRGILVFEVSREESRAEAQRQQRNGGEIAATHLSQLLCVFVSL